MPTPPLTVPYDRLGPAGTRAELHILDIFDGESRLDDDRLRDQSLRPFKIAARVGKASQPADGIKADFTEEDGSSFLLIPPDVAHTRIEFPGGSFTFHKNSAGEIAQIRFECSAKTPTDARRSFLTHALPYLDYIAYQANVPVFIASLRIEDPSNHRTVVEYVSPYRRGTISQHTVQLLRELDPVYAMYREARNSSSDFYRFLCYHKILEGLLGTMRADLFRKAKDKGLILTRKRDLIPNDPDLAATHKEYIGRPIKEFFDSVLTPHFRNAVAHFVTDDGTVLNMSSSEQLDSFSEIIHVTEVCVRTVIDNFRSMLLELRAAK